MYKKSFLYFVILLLLVNLSSSFLISPPKIEQPFQASLNKQFTIFLFNNRAEDITLETYVNYNFLPIDSKSLLENAIVLNQSSIVFITSDKSKQFTATLTLPSDLPDGIHEIRIGAVEQAVSGLVGSRAANEVRLLITKGNLPVASGGTPVLITQPPKQTSSVISQQAPGGVVEQSSSRSKTFTLVVVTTVVSSLLLIILIILFLLLLARKRSGLAIVSLSASQEGNLLKISCLVRNGSLELKDNVYLDILILNEKLEVIHSINLGPVTIKPHFDGAIERIWGITSQKRGEYTLRASLYHSNKAIMKTIKTAIK